jgi:hypothetical protein
MFIVFWLINHRKDIEFFLSGKILKQKKAPEKNQGHI